MGQMYHGPPIEYGILLYGTCPGQPIEYYSLWGTPGLPIEYYSLWGTPWTTHRITLPYGAHPGLPIELLFPMGHTLDYP